MSKYRSFIHDLVAENQSVETPESWLYWSLMTCISAAAANNYTVRTLKGHLIYYPNIYVMLLGESGLGKGYGVNLAARLVQAAEITRVIKGRSSIQAILKELATAKSQNGKPPITDSRGYIINGELSTAVIADPDALTILTDLFDRMYNPDWTNLLKGDGPEKLKEPYITCLFGSSPAHFYDSVPKANIEGGYIGRNLIIYEDKRSRDLDLIDREDEVDIEQIDRFTSFMKPNFVPHLVDIASKKARLIPTDDARKIYNDWRREWRLNQASYNDTTGFINRVPDHVMKVAMCLCLSRFDNMGIIIADDFKEAISRVVGLVYHNQKTAEATGLDPTAQQTKKVIDYLLSARDNQLMRLELLELAYGNLNPVEMDRAIDTLMELKWVRREKKNNDWLIILTGEPLERLKKFREGQKK